MDKIQINWRKGTLNSECSWHQLSPYIGRMKSSMARSLITQFTEPGDIIYDPFSGAGTIALEGWLTKRHVFAGDLSPYAYVLSKAKMNPPKNLKDAENRLNACWQEATKERETIDLRKTPKWVRNFFQSETLRETLAIRNVMLRRRQYFLLSCLLGILHHWRPGFLSYPSSHTVPYLKDKLYPRTKYPELYAYRAVYPRVLAKVHRAFKRVSKVDRQLIRNVVKSDAMKHDSRLVSKKVSAIITSPPYMNSLSYARDNRLRLWFLGVEDYKILEPAISPHKMQFLNMMEVLMNLWSKFLVRDGVCILVLGAVRRNGKYHRLPENILEITSHKWCRLKPTAICKNAIPDIRRARIDCCSTREETIIILRKRN